MTEILTIHGSGSGAMYVTESLEGQCTDKNSRTLKNSHQRERRTQRTIGMDGDWGSVVPGATSRERSKE